MSTKKISKRKGARGNVVESRSRYRTRKITLACLILFALAAATVAGARSGWFGTRTMAPPPPQSAPSLSKEYIYAGGRLIATEEGTGGSSCTFTLSSTSGTFTSSGGTDSVNVTTTTACSWTAQSNDYWITINSGASGTGSGSVNYSVAANGTPSTRTGSMTIAQQTFTVTQSGSTCSYSISPMNQSFVSAGGTGTVNVGAASSCSWTATSDSGWLTVTSGASGSGNGSVNYSVGANSSSASRTGHISIADKTFTATQSGTGGSCGVSINPTRASYPSSGGSGTISVTTQTGCQWSAASLASFVTITSGSSGTGSGTVSYSVAANSTTKSRTGVITVGSKGFVVNQSPNSGGGGGGTGTGLTGEYYNFSSQPPLDGCVAIEAPEEKETQRVVLLNGRPRLTSASGVDREASFLPSADFRRSEIATL